MKKTETAALLSARLAGVALVYFLSARAGLEFAVVGQTVTLVWPPSGVALGAILVFGYRMSAGVFAGAFLVNILTDVSGLVAIGIAAGNTLEALVGSFALRIARFRPGFERRRDVFAFIILAATLATMLSASIGVLALMLGGEVADSALAGAWLTWWLGDMMGVLVVAPLLLLGFSQPHPQLGLRQGVEAVALLVGLLAVGYKIFLVPELSGQGGLAAALAMLPFVIWGALRFSLWGASLVTLMFSVLAIWGTTQGNGPFAFGSPQESLLHWCAFTNLLAITGLLLAASSAEEQRGRRALQEAHGRLERRVLERTAELARINAGQEQEMEERKRLESALIQADERQQRTLG
jgi:integral membrane sensor domain MASE1